MNNDVDGLLKDNETLIHEKEEIQIKLQEATELIEGIKSGNIDAVFIANNKFARVLVSKTADQAYRRFIENMSEGVLTLHIDGTILYSNSSFAKLINLPLEHVIGKNLRLFIPPEDRNAFERFFNNPQENNSKLDLSIKNPDGKCSYYIVSLTLLNLLDFGALNLVWTDVTNQKEIEAKLKSVNETLTRAIEVQLLSESKVITLNNKLKQNNDTLKEANMELSTFAHIASHDLQEPLRKIMTYSSILTSDYSQQIDQKGQSYLEKIQNGSMRMRELINDILEYSEISKKNIIFEPLNLQLVVNEVLSDLEIVIAETKAEITIERDLSTIEGNSSQLRQLFQNILSNSLKFIKPGRVPQLSIAYDILEGKDIVELNGSRLNESFCMIRIRDNGIGMDPVYLNKIFTIFQKLNNNSVYPGTGIGLAICKKIVEKHNGVIKAESKLDEGSLFTIILPLKYVASQENQKTEHDQEEYQ